MPATVQGFKPVAAVSPAGSPYASGSPALDPPDVSVNAPVEEFASNGPSDTLNLLKKIVALRVDYTDISALSTKYLGPIFPDNSFVTRAYYKVLTTFTSGGGDAASIGIGFNTDDAQGIVATVAISAGTPWDVGYHECIQDGAAGNFGNQLTAARQLEFLRGGGQDLTAGALILFVEYVTAE